MKRNIFDYSKIIKKSDHIVSYYNYDIYDDGRVFSYFYHRFLPTRILSQYSTVQLQINEKREVWLVHRLVAFCFIPNPNNLPEVNHKDLNKLNNYFSNLEWIDRKNNMNHAMMIRPWNNYPSVEIYQQWKKFGKPTIHSIKCKVKDIEFNSLKAAVRYLGYIPTTNTIKKLINKKIIVLI